MGTARSRRAVSLSLSVVLLSFRKSSRGLSGDEGRLSRPPPKWKMTLIVEAWVFVVVMLHFACGTKPALKAAFSGNKPRVLPEPLFRTRTDSSRMGTGVCKSGTRRERTKTQRCCNLCRCRARVSVRARSFASLVMIAIVVPFLTYAALPLTLQIKRVSRWAHARRAPLPRVSQSPESFMNTVAQRRGPWFLLLEKRKKFLGNPHKVRAASERAVLQASTAKTRLAISLLAFGRKHRRQVPFLLPAASRASADAVTEPEGDSSL